MRELLKAILPGPIQRFLRNGLDTARAWVCWIRMRLPQRHRGHRSLEPTDTLTLGLLAMRFPPEVGGGAYRPASFARYASEAGLHVTVIASRARQRLTPAGQYLASQIPSNVVVHRARPDAQFAFPSCLPSFAGGFLELIGMYQAGDRAFSRHGPDVILATGPQFYTFVAGQRLAARYSCPLVLDYRDEWTECPFDFIQAGPLDRKWEKRCLAAADLVIFTTESQLARALDVFSELDADRCAVVPNGWEPRDWEALPDYDASQVTDGPRVVSFLGNLGSHTPPDEFLGDLERCLGSRPDLRERLRFRFVGYKPPASAAALAAFAWPKMIESVDPVPKSEASRLMRDSAALLIMNAPSLHRYIPGKLYEYLAAGPPIIVHGSGGEVGSLVERLEAGHVMAFGDTSGMTGALESVAAGAALAPRADRGPWLKTHTREANARRMVDLVRPLGERR